MGGIQRGFLSTWPIIHGHHLGMNSSIINLRLRHEGIHGQYLASPIPSLKTFY